MHAASIAAALSLALLSACSARRMSLPSVESSRTLDAALAAPTPLMQRVLDKAPDHRVQIVLSELVPQPDGRTTLRSSSYRAGAEYFYPASTIKLLGAIAACERFDEIDAARTPHNRQSLSAFDAPLAFAPLFSGQSTLERDPSNLAGEVVTLRHELRKLFLVSDNPAYNRLYELVGQDELNQRLWRAGLASVRLSHRLSEGRTAEQNRLTPQIDVRLPEGPFSIPQRRGSLDLAVPNMPGLAVGSAYLRGSDERVDSPMNFADKSCVSLLDLHRALIMLARPDVDLGLPGFQLSPETRRALLDIMREYPADSPNPRYDRAEYPDDYGKFFLPGLLRRIPKDQLRIANKVGQAYGFTIDNAFIEHVPSGRAFVLSCVLYTNDDGVLNDNVYEYDQTAFPFLADLAERIAGTLWPDLTISN